MIRPARAILVATVLLGSLALGAGPASAESRVTVRNDRGTAQADFTYATKLTIAGSGFQVVEGGFGGVYVMFGWVSDPGGGSWRPSRGGLTGEDYRYIPDSESSADNNGYLNFVAFPGSSTAGEAQAVMSGSGGFSVELTVPGPIFQSVDRDGDVATVDCRKQTCGVITIGAHGVKNPANETFTRISFGDVYDEAPGTSDESTDDADSPAGTTDQDDAEAPADEAKPVGKPAVAVDRLTAVAGHALAFTGRGFAPGEQVLAILDDGVASIGPMVAGSSGEVAGVILLPADLSAGTHEIRLSGAASGAAPSERFPVRTAGVAATTPASASSGDEGDDTEVLASRIFLAAAGAVFLVALVSVVLRSGLARRRRTTTAQA